MNTKSLFASKTFWFNVLALAAGASASPVVGLLPPTAVSYIAAASGIANIILRTVTNQGVTVLPAAK